jgi:arsenite methyltransferase
MVVITANQRDIIFDAVRTMYTDVATRPGDEYHFPTGRRATAFVGYPPAVRDALPEPVVESFAGVGYPFAANVIRPGDTVLDIGSGSGTDVMIAAGLVGPSGTVIGLDMTEAMREKLAANAKTYNVANVSVLAGHAEKIPLPDASVDVVTSNGVLNLVPEKRAAVREIFRVLKPGGRVQIADIVVGTPPSEACRSQPQLWAECIVGATTEEDFLAMFREAGFSKVEVLSHLDYFAGSGSESTRNVAGSFGARTMVMRAVRGGGSRRRAAGSSGPPAGGMARRGQRAGLRRVRRRPWLR